MNVGTIYTNFVNHTNLTDSVYETIFTKVKERIEFLNSISWNTLEYRDTDDGEVKGFDFRKLSNIPYYGVELIQNIFENYYTLPEHAIVELSLSVGDTEYRIKSTSKSTEIPSNLESLRSDKLYKMFFMTDPVYDIFGEFDELFQFTESFKTKLENVFPPLMKRFETVSGREAVANNLLTDSSIAQTQLTVEKIQSNIKDILERIDGIRKERDDLISTKNKILSGLNTRESWLYEKEKVSIEYKTMRETYDLYSDRLEKINGVLHEIEKELNDYVDLNKDGNEEYIKSLQDKKVVFNREKDSYSRHLLELDGVIQSIVQRLSEIDSSLEDIEKYTASDLETIDKTVKDLDKEQDELYGFLIGLEGKLKQNKTKLADDALYHERALTYEDITIRGVEHSTIVSHLASPLQPSTVITVVNYLRYYFSYCTTVLTKELLQQAPDADTYIAQAIATRRVLTKHFGLFYNQLFSFANFADNRIKKLMLMIR